MVAALAPATTAPTDAAAPTATPASIQTNSRERSHDDVRGAGRGGCRRCRSPDGCTTGTMSTTSRRYGAIRAVSPRARQRGVAESTSRMPRLNPPPSTAA